MCHLPCVIILTSALTCHSQSQCCPNPCLYLSLMLSWIFLPPSQCVPYPRIAIPTPVFMSLTLVSLFLPLFLCVTYLVSLFLPLFLCVTYLVSLFLPLFLCVTYLVSLFLPLFLCVTYLVSLFLPLFLCVTYLVSLFSPLSVYDTATFTPFFRSHLLRRSSS